MSILGMLLGVGFFSALLWFWEKGFDKRDKKKRRSKIMSSKDEKFKLPSAAVSTDLMPLLEYHLKSGDTLCVVGTGHYFLPANSNRTTWTDGLKRLLSKGIKIVYILVDAPSEAIGELITFTSEVESCNMTTRLIYSNSSKAAERKLANTLRAQHPTIAYSAKEEPRLIWLEKDHPEGSMHAYDIEFTPPSKFNQSDKEKFSVYWGQFKEAQKCGHKLPPNEKNKIAA